VIRRQRPVLARQADVCALAATSGAMIAGAGCTRRARAGTLAWSGACWMMLRWHLGMVDRPGREPRLVAADTLTLARLWGSPIVFSVRREQLLGVLALAAASDVLDGPLARRHGATRLGRDADSAADLAVLVSALARPDLLPPTARVALAARVLAPAALTAAHYFRDADRPAWAQRHASRHAATPTLLGVAVAARGAQRAGGALVVVGSVLALSALRRSMRESSVAAARSYGAKPGSPSTGGLARSASITDDPGVS